MHPDHDPRDLDAAQDIVQEVFCECLQGKRQALSRSYLFRAVRNRALNRIRANSRYLRAMERFSEFIKDTIEQMIHPGSSIMDHLNQLPRKQKEVLLLRIKADLKVSEIAQVLEIPEGTVKSRINTALGSLRKEWKGHANESV